ncbi:hypothetical protein Tcan_11325 [Toxocara canis]|uniref:Uncharacterized protein n=1 Tax=Toxocara canis TaxID=6265 RepID=A0A0B2VY32_TOXCA|nr:hypothetical protein Tcan_11325 [Toxocara canis]
MIGCDIHSVNGVLLTNSSAFNFDNKTETKKAIASDTGGGQHILKLAHMAYGEGSLCIDDFTGEIKKQYEPIIHQDS